MNHHRSGVNFLRLCGNGGGRLAGNPDRAWRLLPAAGRLSDRIVCIVVAYQGG